MNALRFLGAKKPAIFGYEVATKWRQSGDGMDTPGANFSHHIGTEKHKFVEETRKGTEAT